MLRFKLHHPIHPFTNLSCTHLLPPPLGLHFIILLRQHFCQRIRGRRILVQECSLDPSIPFDIPAHVVHVIMVAVSFGVPTASIFVLVVVIVTFFFIVDDATYWLAIDQRQTKSQVDLVRFWSPYDLTNKCRIKETRCIIFRVDTLENFIERRGLLVFRTTTLVMCVGLVTVGIIGIRHFRCGVQYFAGKSLNCQAFCCTRSFLYNFSTYILQCR
mmetsp:Transcript_6221/g.11117  ORF Transcript_6221/g.11117 Transcript_6221/m.11117 type:complete len:215 (+) Transcript_6221:1271-1915(+)